MTRAFMCSSYTVSGVMPGGPAASRHTLADRLAACAAAGYAGYWLHWRDYLEQRAAGLDDAALAALFDRHGMAHRGVEFFADWFLADGPGAAETAAFAAARAIGARVVNVGADFDNRDLPRATMVARFEALCARAADRGLAIALEPVPWSDVPDIASALPFLTADNAGLAIDCWHMFRGKVPLGDIAMLPAGRMLCVQVNDAAAEPAGMLAEETTKRLACGEGAFDLAGFAAAVDATGATTPFSVEIISPRFVALPVAEAARLSFTAVSRVIGDAPAANDDGRR